MQTRWLLKGDGLILVKSRIEMGYSFIAIALLTWKFTRGLIETHRSTAMHSVRLFIFLLAGLCLTVGTGSSVPPSSIEKSSENRAAGVQPVLRLEKDRYLLGEAIRFSVGGMPKNSTVIPHELTQPCSLSVTEPSRSHSVESVGWPNHWNLDHAWS